MYDADVVVAAAKVLGLQSNNLSNLNIFECYMLIRNQCPAYVLFQNFKEIPFIAFTMRSCPDY